MKIFLISIIMSVACISPTHSNYQNKIKSLFKRSIVVFTSSLALPIIAYTTEPVISEQSATKIDSFGDIGFLRPPPVTTRQKIIRASESILTNPILENLRKADQLDDDESEIESTKALFLVPILNIQSDLISVEQTLKELTGEIAKQSVNVKLEYIMKILRFFIMLK